jgi:hypothetical protein
MKKRALVAFVLSMLLFAPAAFAQQTGSISGKVTMPDGSPVPGVTVEAKSDVLPTPRVTVTEANGDYRLPALQPGNYTVTFSLQGMRAVTREALVQLGQDTPIGAQMSVEGITEAVTVRAEAPFIDRSSAEIKVGLTNTHIQALPAGQDYRDLIKLVPGITFTQDAVRGPSAGGSGQDNIYQFDGANVTLPLFGTLASEPASHDIAQVTTIKGGARAVDFDRAGGFSIDSVSKTGTNRWMGLASFQFYRPKMVSDLKIGRGSRFEQSRTWVNLNAGGPVIPTKLFFYGSYYRPERQRDNVANRYGELPDYTSTRNEGFGKLTYTPFSSVLINGSYRDSRRRDEGDIFGEFSAATTGTADESHQRIGLVEGSWIISSRSHATFKYSYFGLETDSEPVNIVDMPALTIGTQLNPATLDQVGRLTVPSIINNQPAYNAFIQPLIDRYGFINDAGVLAGGGFVGVAPQFNFQDFFRNNIQVGYNLTLGTNITHELHAGYQRFADKEVLLRRSNGWGIITVPGGRLTAIPGTGQSAFYSIETQRQPAGGEEPIINSEYESHNLEINDTIRWGNLTLNAGLLASYDILYGQGLREDSSAPSGFVSAPFNKYKMKTLPFDEMLQPRVSATWAYNGSDTIFAGFAVYKPSVNSLPRAASWDRNLIGTFIDSHFDANGVLFAQVPRGSSTGKLFADGMKPRTTNEYTAGTARQINDRLSIRLYGRYRESKHFWEDAPNNGRTAAFGAPAHIADKGLYIPDLAAKLAPLGITAGAGTYVLAELDDAYTKYQEVTLESEWRGARTFFRGSYTWSHYYGNIDQDNTSAAANDSNIFIGSSNFADGIGRNVWDMKDGTLRGDRPHLLKLMGAYNFPWQGQAGAFVVAQSGQAWEMWSFEPYIALTTNTSDLIRYAEPAGSRRTNPHWQMDVKYTQDIPIASRYRLQIVGDLYNVFDQQTGYNVQPAVHTAGFGVPRNWYDPRRFELSVRFQF